MKGRAISLLRNIGIAAHIDAGKTTLTERMLFFSGKSHKLGETHQGNSQMDTSRQEIEKGITISAAATQTNWSLEDRTFVINIIDTPGHIDFTIEVERSLRILDGLVMLFDAVAGVESQSEHVWQQSTRYEVPTLAYVNKMDRAGADFMNVIHQIREQLQANAWPLQLPVVTEQGFVGVIDLLHLEARIWSLESGQGQTVDIPVHMLAEARMQRQALLEEVATFDEALMEAFLQDSASVSIAQWQAAIRKAVRQRDLVPVLAGAAYKNIAVQPLLDAICRYLPSPADLAAIQGVHPETQVAELRSPEADQAFAALVFKVLLDERNRRLCFFRVYSGELQAGQTVLNVRTGKRERISQLYKMHANKKTEISTVMAGDIAATLSAKTARTGDSLCSPDAPIQMERLHVPEPVISIAIEASRTADLDKLAIALARIAEEDPTFRVQKNQGNGQTIIMGMGELHLEVVLSKLRDEFGIRVNTGHPEVNYLEQFQERRTHWSRLKKQRGGPGLFAEIQVEIGPADASFMESEAFRKGQRLQFVDRSQGGTIPKAFQPFIEKGFASAMASGPLGGYPVQGMKVVLLDGTTHPNDSKPIAFERCAVNAFREIAEQLKPQLLEPVMKVEVQVPTSFMGSVIGELHRRRGSVREQQTEGERAMVVAEVPLAEMFGYVGQLRSTTRGRGTFSMQLHTYGVVPTELRSGLLEG